MNGDGADKPKTILGRVFGAKDSAKAEPADETAPENSDAAAPSADHPASVPGTDMPATLAKSGWFDRLKSGLSKTSSKLSSGITGLFSKRKLDGATLEDLEDLLIQADLGVETSLRITDAISKGRYEKGISADEVRAILAQEVERTLAPVARPLNIDASKKPHVMLVVGVNGSGKNHNDRQACSSVCRRG